MALGGMTTIRSLRCDIPARSLEIWHTDDHEPILARLITLDLGTSFLESIAVEDVGPSDEHEHQRSILWQVFVINGFFFALEMLTGFLSHSMGLVADSLDMLADSIIYGLALFAVGGTLARKKEIAKASGILQTVLAVLGFVEILRRFAGFEEMPHFQTMIIVSCFALLGNAASLYLLQKRKSADAHIQASVICTSNDVIVNFGVIVAGALVLLTGSPYPDLIVGTIVLVIVFRGALRILKLAR
jgi:Co/Zn/Cd efflux system component